jgi:hypothetical protein
MLGPGAPKGKILDTVIIDETSMMTEEMLAALLEAVGGAKRILLVGDHRQLPPIGAGRPFADIVRRLQPDRVESLFPKVAKGYAELTFNWRQDPSAPDTRLAAWFAGTDPGPGEEGILSRSVRLLTSARTARLPAPSVFLAACSEPSFKPQMATRAPSLLNSCAAASPIPLLPPVIRIFLSASLPMIVPPYTWMLLDN